MPDRDFDLIVLGAGSGGVRCARVAGQLGARVAVVESSRLGGTCVNLGCVPKKLYAVGSRFGDAFLDAAAFGWDVAPPPHRWAAMRDAVAAEVGRLNGIYGRLLDAAGCETIRGFGTIEDPHTVRVGDRRITADRILIATGGQPMIPPVPGRELTVTSNALFSLPDAPRRIVILGGGYIGVEFACIFRGVGAEVALVNQTACVLTSFDHDVRDHLAAELARQGIALHLGRSVSSVRATDDGARAVTLDDGTELNADLVVLATGRRPRTADLGLAAVGVATDDWGAVVVDGDYRSSVPSIYAIGDVTGGLTLTPIATAEGHWLAERWFGDADRPRVEYDLVPTTVFCRPHVGTVGMTERQARDAGHDLQIYKAAFRPLAALVAGREERALIKLVVDRVTDRVLGLHVVADDAGEIVQGFAVAMKAGATKRDFDRTIGIHPTLAEELVTLRAPAG
jgi:glutathione reductase (NADPH)